MTTWRVQSPLHYHAMNIPSIEDPTRYTAPPEPRPEGRWEEPEDHPDYLETFSDEPEPEPQPE